MPRQFPPEWYAAQAARRKSGKVSQVSVTDMTGVRGILFRRGKKISGVYSAKEVSQHSMKRLNKVLSASMKPVPGYSSFVRK